MPTAEKTQAPSSGTVDSAAGAGSLASGDGGSRSGGWQRDVRGLPFGQQEARLAPEGPPGSGLWAQLPQKAGGTGQRLLRQGSSGPEVQDLQWLLDAVAAAQVEVDGKFGPRTRAAVVGFQRQAGLAADGVVGPLTWGALLGGPASPADTPSGGPGHLVEATAGPQVPELARFLGAAFRSTSKALSDGGSGDLMQGPSLAKQQAAPAAPSPFVPHFAAWATAIESTQPDTADPVLPADLAMSTALAFIASLPIATTDPTQATPQSTSVLQVQACSTLLSFLSDPAAVKSLIDIGSRETVDRWQLRVTLMRQFYASFVPNADPDTADPTQEAVSGRRHAMVGLALAQVGKVRAKKTVEEGGVKVKDGWRTLDMIFSATTNWPNRERAVRDPKVSLASWCGIFATWAAINAGMAVPPWRVGGGGVSALKNDQGVVRIPKPGDVVNRNGEKHTNPTTGESFFENHFGIITWVDPVAAKRVKTEQDVMNLDIRTVEGNADTASEIRTRGTKVRAWDLKVRNIEQSG